MAQVSMKRQLYTSQHSGANTARELTSPILRFFKVRPLANLRRRRMANLRVKNAPCKGRTWWPGTPAAHLSISSFRSQKLGVLYRFALTAVENGA